MKVKVSQSNRKNKKWKIETGEKTIHIGDSRYQDYTQHKDLNRRRSYVLRHRGREDWTKSGMNTAGFWSYWLLWNKDSMDKAKKDISKKFNIVFI